MTGEQRTFRSAPDVWSPNQVTHHVFTVEKLSVETMEKLEGRKSAPRSLAEGCKKLVVQAVLGAGIKVKNPTRTTPDPEIDFEEIESEWPAVRARLEQLLARTDDPASAAGIRHPIAGPHSLAESIEFLAAHLEHHLRQLGRIQAAADYPAG
jgi:hypothetical protein